MEPGKKIRETNSTIDNEYMTDIMAREHFHEIPDYCSRPDKMEKETGKELFRLSNLDGRTGISINPYFSS